MQTTPNNTSQPLISFIVTDYNIPEEMLDECLQSLFTLSLNPSEMEVILVDDGSAVSPITTMQTIEDHRDAITYIRQSNQGLSSARNIGIKVASGKYIHFIDGDDYLLRPQYEHCLDIVRYHDPDIVLFDSTSTDKAEVPFTFEGPMSGSAFMHNHNLKASACTYIFKKDILGALQFTPGRLHEDEEFTPQLILRADRLFLTNSKAYFYRKRKGSITSSQDKQIKEKKLTDTMLIIGRLQELSQKLPPQERVALERRVNQLAMDLLYKTIKATHSNARLNQTIEELKAINLFPLPDMKYTRKYSFFRRMISSKAGRNILLMTVR